MILFRKRSHLLFFKLHVLLFLLLTKTTTTTRVTCFQSLTVKLNPFKKGQRTSFLARPPSYSGQLKAKQKRSSQLSMFMGSDGGILGVGTPELVTIVLVGYFVLGPSDLYKLVKEIGKFLQNIRTLGTDLTTSLESNMESSLQLQEIRKAQQELNDAFSFRRSINVDPNAEAFATDATTPRVGETGLPVAAAAGSYDAEDDASPAAAATKKIRRRVKKQPPPQPVSSIYPQDLEIPGGGEDEDDKGTSPAITTVQTPAQSAATNNNRKKLAGDPFVQESSYTDQELAQIQADFDKYTVHETGWYDDPSVAMPASTGADSIAVSSRFQQQLSGNWNEQILSKSDQLSPLGKVMEMIALLEQEKIAANQRLEEEFRKRAEIEESTYRKQRQLLEEAAAQIQKDAFATSSSKKA